MLLLADKRRRAIEAGRNRDCALCPLFKSAQSVCVQGDGNPTAPLMLVGEAPGKREDDLEKPFQGKAGKLLDEVLGELGVDRGQVYIDNVVRCRPPENRRPTDEEVNACRPYLRNVLSIIQPRVVVALGSTALYGITGRTGITKLRGCKIWSKFGVMILPTWHPSYVLRTGKLSRQQFKEDLSSAIKMLGIFDHFRELREEKLR
jgi:uracil-DNA glycosylase